ncbi:MAG: class I SAM-dependent methyltransferase [Sphingobacteriaceae bacterium]|nr:class I SAM-dependent methyltransferase [Sphingobacteriaceae bacterium]MBK7817776.1 class I SAM-dependent methyltransferase [Sphingobacteriaceae bacterium]
MVNSKDNSEWFKDWFNSPYYHLLYNNRNNSEANNFIDNLTKYLQLNKDATVWDLACGKGRHSIKLNELGYTVVGTDLSAESIEEASSFANKKLDFFVHDMRTPFRINYFDAVLNLFTSIGYFKDPRDNFGVFQNVYNALDPKGVFVIDFFNATKVKSCLVTNAVEKRGDLEFTISKRLEGNKIIKQIKFADKGKEHNFEESVLMYTLPDLMNYATKAGFVLKDTFGSYNLERFDEQNSDRLIVVFSK